MLRKIDEIGGMQIETNGSGEIFILKGGVRLRITPTKVGISVSYTNEAVCMVPSGYRTIDFVPMR